MPNELLPEHQATAATTTNDTPPPQVEKEEKDVAAIAADLQAQVDAEVATNKAKNDDPNISEEEAEIVGKKHVEKALADKSADNKEVKEEYTPPSKYKVLDEEKELPEWARGLVTKENEQELLSLFQKADGIDHVKSQRDSERQTRETIEANLGAVAQEIQSLQSWRDKNLGIFFEKVGLPKQKVAAWLLDELQKEELPEPVRRMYTEHEANQRRLAELEHENSQLANRQTVDTVQARTNELGQALAGSEVAPLVSAFDSRVGKPGAFADMVIRHAKAEWEASGQTKDLSVKEAVDQVLNILNLQPSQTSSKEVKPNGTEAKPAATKVVQRTKPVVLPNIVGGTGASAAGKRVKSVDDIRKVYREMQSQN